ncbi:dephospho-CoA kinase [Ammoniphilus sp. CFH 90114]|uniref:dephospho-CoA kinase n=1 Tax=Ammoniphilus sp. CFH 90114 TaxID=2493665 RepID=UPI00100FAA65|nr:dephospho-CoA kinase [Ammoniphilus sp. CFH 90114]RXT04955.1 dephospho-CoA kinase [Ammoniphilus sp. CFH 90114]
MIVGLTGGIACGKSTVARMFEQLGCVIIDADQVAREVVAPGEEGLEAVVRRFGPSVLNEDGTLDRKSLGDLVFKEEKARQDLNAILHPLIRKRMNQKKEKALKDHPPLIIMDIPLLYESKQEQTVEAVIVVYVSPDEQLRRLMERDHLTYDDAKRRINSQWSIEEKKQRADYLVDNSGSLFETREQVESLFFKLVKEIGNDGIKS